MSSKIAFIFAGQGSQYSGMGNELYNASKAARDILNEAENLRPGTLEQCFRGDAATLAVTVNTQPCVFAVDMACAAALSEAGVRADAAAGFSLGELAAVCYCGVLPFGEAFKLVCERGRLMQSAAKSKPGAMSAILRLDADTVTELCEAYSEVFPVNFNCPGQTVVSGDEEQLAALEADVAAKRGRVVRLKVSGSFHSPFMEEASEGLMRYMEKLAFAPPAIPLYANATAEQYGDPRLMLAAQVKRPVLWQRSIERMQADGIDTFIEVGPGKTLTGFVQKIGNNGTCVNVEDTASLCSTLLAVRGGEV